MLNYVSRVHISLCDNVSFNHPRRKPVYNCWNSLHASVVLYIYKYFLLGGHVDIKTGSTYKIGWGNVEFGTIRAYFDVGKCSNRIGILENLGVCGRWNRVSTLFSVKFISTSGFDV